MRKLIPIILVIGVFLTACSAEETPAPTEVATPTSVATVTLVPTATPAPTPTPIPEPEPSPEYGPPPIIELTVVYPDGVSVTVPIYCPVPAEYCDSAVEVYDANGEYWGLGFSLPEGTPIYAAGEGSLNNTWVDNEDPAFIFRYDLTVYLSADPINKPIDWDHLDERHWADPITFYYDYIGFNTTLPDPIITDGWLDFPEGMFPLDVEGGQELGRAIGTSLEQIPPYGTLPGINLVLMVETRASYIYDGVHLTEISPQIHLSCQSPLAPEPTLEPASQSDLVVVLPDGSEVPITWPVPEEYRDIAIEVEVHDVAGSYIGLGFRLPEGTPIFAVTNGVLGDYRFYPSRDKNDVFVYTFSFDLRGTEIDFWYTYNGFSSVFLNPTIMSGVPYFPSPPTITVSGGEKLGSTTDRDPTVDRAFKTYGADNQEVRGINLVISARHPVHGTLRIRIN